MRHSLWPTPAQEALLRAALADGDEAISEFDKWISQVDLERDVDGATYRLLPLLYRNLARLGCKHAMMPLLAGVYRRTWCEAQTRQRQLAAPLSLLHQNGIAVMASKGIVLAHHHYSSPGLRPMSDVDLIVPRERAVEALHLLEVAGWKMLAKDEDHWGARRNDMVALVTGVALTRDDSAELDLQWRLVHECRHRAADQRFWANATLAEIAGHRLLRPSATDLLFHVIIHGVRPNELSPIRWIADAAMILRSEGDAIDWDDLLRFSEQMRLRFRLGLGLSYLSETFGLELPVAVLKSARVSPGWVERIERRSNRELLAGPLPKGKASFTFLASLVRLGVGDGRSALPRIALKWLKQRLRRVATAKLRTAS